MHRNRKSIQFNPRYYILHSGSKKKDAMTK